MNKDLNHEYSELMRSDLPDLWDRISENLPEKSVRKKQKRTRIYQFTAVAAACVCVAVIIPVLVMNNRMGSSGAKVEYAMATAEIADEEMKGMEMEEAAPAAAMAEDAEESEMIAQDAVPAEAMAKGAAAEDSAQAEVFEAAADEAAAEEPMQANMKASTAFSDSDAGFAASGAAEELPMPESTPMPEEEAVAAPVDSGLLIKDISVTITRSFHDDVFSNATLYDAIVTQTNEEYGLEEGDKIILVADDNTNETIRESLTNGDYTLSFLQREFNGETLYFIQ